MVTVTPHLSTRAFEPLPVDPRRGLPQAFPLRFAGEQYHFTLYANLSAEDAAEAPEVIRLPTPRGGCLVVRVDRVGEAGGGGAREPLMRRKVAPGLDYAVGPIVLHFPEARLARAHLNGRGDAGSSLSGWIAERWP